MIVSCDWKELERGGDVSGAGTPHQGADRQHKQQTFKITADAAVCGLAGVDDPAILDAVIANWSAKMRTRACSVLELLCTYRPAVLRFAALICKPRGADPSAQEVMAEVRVNTEIHVTIRKLEASPVLSNLETSWQVLVALASLWAQESFLEEADTHDWVELVRSLHRGNRHAKAMGDDGSSRMCSKILFWWWLPIIGGVATATCQRRTM